MELPRLESLRIDADKTQQHIADVLGCKREVYRRYEKGIHDLPLWALVALAKYYRTSTDYILHPGPERYPGTLSPLRAQTRCKRAGS